MLVHGIAGEQSRFRRFLLYVFARYVEVPLLRTCYHLLRGNGRWIGKRKWFRSPAALLLARPFGYLGDTGKPMPFDEALSLIDALDGPLGVGPCRCRTGHGACPHPLETDIVIRTGFHAWMKAFPKEYREITKEEAKTIVRTAHSLGMFHMVFVHCPVNLYNEYAICNCCTCGCVPYIINRDLSQMNYPLIDGYFLAATDRTKCRACRQCIETCPFSAREIVLGKGKTAGNCFGCGLCHYACPEGAIEMVRLREPLPPRDRNGNPPPHHHTGLYRRHEPYRER